MLGVKTQRTEFTGGRENPNCDFASAATQLLAVGGVRLGHARLFTIRSRLMGRMCGRDSSMLKGPRICI